MARPRLVGHKDKLMTREDLDQVLAQLDESAVSGRPMPHYIARNRQRAGEDLETRRETWVPFWRAARLVVRLLVQSGLRCEELAKLEVRDCDIGSRPYRIIVRGGKKRSADELDAVLIPPALGAELAEWIAAHQLQPHDTLIRNRRGGRCSRRWIYELAKAPVRACGLNPKFATHHYRHRYATTLLQKSDGNLMVVQKQLRHRSLQPTSTYLHMADYEETTMEAIESMGLGDVAEPSSRRPASRRNRTLAMQLQSDEEQRRRRR